ncbi:MAG: DUF393 domain-containing protein [Planctomycetes bacterium]|nr:DUF393 domain-containing protein [Planctomycetota bacterium]MCB9917921.1 DUF393 domain-containing protein [Planctomycetota bacterium]
MAHDTEDRTAANTANGSTELVLYDSECRLCRGAVRFIIDRDPHARFSFASLASSVGTTELAAAGFADDPGGSLVLVTPYTSKIPMARGSATTERAAKRSYRRSDAALRIAARLRFPWPCFAVFLIVPTFLRDPVYRLVARYRYRWFGKVASTGLPVPDAPERFVDRDQATLAVRDGACGLDRAQDCATPMDS